MPRKKRWSIGDIFSIKQSDGYSTIGQTLDLMMPNIVSCALYDIRYLGDVPPERIELPFEKLFSAITVNRHFLDSGAWPILAHATRALKRKLWPNERFRELGWVGAVSYDCELAEDFLEAFYGLAAWDDGHDPNFLDEFLISPDKKPKNLIYKKS